MAAPACALGQGNPGSFASRTELAAAASRAELAARAADPGSRARNASLAGAIRQRLLDGDFQVGDRIIVAIVSDVMHRDTVAVRPGQVIELPGRITIVLTGVLRSELQERVSTEVMKYVKAQQIEVTPLMRVGVLGEVARPGYFAFASDIPISDAIMGAGGPTATADLERSTIRRGNQEFRSADETRSAIASGLTLDQLGLKGGDELVVGRRREVFAPALFGVFGMLASVAAIFVAVHHR